MAETAHHLLLVQVSSGALQATNSLHLLVPFQGLISCAGSLLLGTRIQPVELVRLRSVSGDPVVVVGEYIIG